MELEPVEQFLQAGNRKFSFLMLINAHSRLSLLQMNKGNVSFEDIVQCLNLGSGPEVTSVELNAHAALIYEGALVPVLTTKGPLLRLSKELLANDANFLKAVITVMYAHGGGVEHPAIEDFKVEATKFLKKSISTVSSAPSEANNIQSFVPQSSSESVENNIMNRPSSMSIGGTTATTAAGDLSSLAIQTKPMTTADSFSQSLQQQQQAQQQPLVPGRISALPSPSVASQQQGPYSSNVSSVSGIPSQQQQMFNTNNPNFGAPVRRFSDPIEEARGPISDIEKTEPIIRLLAHIRKEGMDILFPQIIQDKVRAIHCLCYVFFLISSLFLLGFNVCLRCHEMRCSFSPS
jgi:hypothetical protein